MNNLTQEFSRFLLNQGVNKVTVRNYRYDINKFLVWFKITTGQELTADNFQLSYLNLYQQYLSSNNTHPGNIRRYLASLKKFYAWLKSPSDLPVIPSLNPPALANKIIHDFSLYLKLNGLSRMSIRNYLRDLSKFIRWFESVNQKSFSLDVLDQSIGQQYDQYLTKINIPATTRRRYQTTLNQFGNFLDLTKQKSSPSAP